MSNDEFAFTDDMRPDGYMQALCYEVHKRLKIEFKKIRFETTRLY